MDSSTWTRHLHAARPFVSPTTLQNSRTATPKPLEGVLEFESPRINDTESSEESRHQRNAGQQSDSSNFPERPHALRHRKPEGHVGVSTNRTPFDCDALQLTAYSSASSAQMTAAGLVPPPFADQLSQAGPSPTTIYNKPENQIYAPSTITSTFPVGAANMMPQKHRAMEMVHLQEPDQPQLAGNIDPPTAVPLGRCWSSLECSYISGLCGTSTTVMDNPGAESATSCHDEHFEWSTDHDTNMNHSPADQGLMECFGHIGNPWLTPVDELSANGRQSQITGQGEYGTEQDEAFDVEVRREFGELRERITREVDTLVSTDAVHISELELLRSALSIHEPQTVPGNPLELTVMESGYSLGLDTQRIGQNSCYVASSASSAAVDAPSPSAESKTGPEYCSGSLSASLVHSNQDGLPIGCAFNTTQNTASPELSPPTSDDAHVAAPPNSPVGDSRDPDTKNLGVNLVYSISHESIVCCVRFSHDGKYVATGCNRSAQIFDAQTGERICVLEDRSEEQKTANNYIRTVCFSPDGRYLATGAEDKLIRLWDIESRSIHKYFAGHKEGVYSLDFAPDGRTIASGSCDKSLRLWDVERGINTLNLSLNDGVTTVAFSPDSQRVAAGSVDTKIYVFNAQSGSREELLYRLDGHTNYIHSVAFSPNGKSLISGSLDGRIKWWELGLLTGDCNSDKNNGKCIKTFEGHEGFVLSVAWAPDATWILSGSRDRTARIWDRRTGLEQPMRQVHGGTVLSVAVSPQGGLLATGCEDMKVRIWSYRSPLN